MWTYNHTNEMYTGRYDRSEKLYHSDVYLGQDYSDGIQHFKYIKREKVNGKWVYYYKDDLYDQAAKKTNTTMSKYTKAEGAYNKSNAKQKQATQNYTMSKLVTKTAKDLNKKTSKWDLMNKSKTKKGQKTAIASEEKYKKEAAKAVKANTKNKAKYDQTKSEYLDAYNQQQKIKSKDKFKKTLSKLAIKGLNAGSNVSAAINKAKKNAKSTITKINRDIAKDNPELAKDIKKAKQDIKKKTRSIKRNINKTIVEEIKKNPEGAAKAVVDARKLQKDIKAKKKEIKSNINEAIETGKQQSKAIKKAINTKKKEIKSNINEALDLDNNKAYQKAKAKQKEYAKAANDVAAERERYIKNNPDSVDRDEKGRITGYYGEAATTMDKHYTKWSNDARKQANKEVAKAFVKTMFKKKKKK